MKHPGREQEFVKKNLKSIDFVRQKIKSKNLNYKFYRIDKENIEIIKNAGWHFNNIMSPELISLKLKLLHIQNLVEVDFLIKCVKKIKLKIRLISLRGVIFIKSGFRQPFPSYLIENLENIRLYIVNERWPSVEGARLESV